jgi:hypothetical protein
MGIMKWKAIVGLFMFLIFVPVGLEANGAPNAALDVISDAYAHYKISQSYLRAGETELGEISLEQFVAKWEQVTKSFSAAPPAPFDKDPKLPASFAEILKAAKDGQASLVHGDISKAIADLEPVRAILAEVRRRNGIRTLSDCIDDVSNEIKLLQNVRERSFDVSDSTQIQQAFNVMAELGPMLERCQSQPPERNRDQFDRLVQQASHSVENAREALAARDAKRFVRILRELRSIDHILFQKFD